MSAFYLKAGDTEPPLAEYLYNADGTVPSPMIAVQFHLADDNTGAVIVNAPATSFDPVTGLATYQWQTADTATAGTFIREWEITLSGGHTITVPNDQPGYAVVITPQID